MKDQLLNEFEAAEEIRKSVGTLRNWRCSGLDGPPYIKCGRNVLYRASDLERYLDSRRVVPAGIEQ
jgi:hypothetical protein